MFNGFTGLCQDFIAEHPGYFVIPVRITGSAIESVFSCLKNISGGNLTSINYTTSLQHREKTSSSREDTYRKASLHIK